MSPTYLLYIFLLVLLQITAICDCIEWWMMECEISCFRINKWMNELSIELPDGMFDWMEIIKVDSLLLVRAVKFYVIGFIFIYIKENEL